MLQQKSTEEDERIVEQWLQTKASSATREAYGRDAADFQNWANKPLGDLSLDDVLAYSRRLDKEDYEVRSCRRKLAAVKSLLGFAHQVGYLQLDPGKARPLPTSTNDLAERILRDAALVKM